ANAVGAAPTPLDGAPSPLADASSRPLSPPRERHGPCRAATIEPPTGRVVPPTAPRVRAFRPLSPPRERHGPCRAATIEPPTGRVVPPTAPRVPATIEPPTGRVVPPTAPRVRALSRRRRWSSANAVGAAPSPSDGVPSPLADASSRPLSPPRERHGPCRPATTEPPTGRVVPPTAPRVR
ncbi:hypothetical protein EMIHUDRAFT_57855, partial [Emiliania huxleyi CCMP1516]|uniref:Uncharacterized protein n=2 Tax=Emiliania huxleyi TaxID=2903 RepID=A0A0D3JD64_EMIH1